MRTGHLGHYKVDAEAMPATPSVMKHVETKPSWRALSPPVCLSLTSTYCTPYAPATSTVPCSRKHCARRRGRLARPSRGCARTGVRVPVRRGYKHNSSLACPTPWPRPWKQDHGDWEWSGNTVPSGGHTLSFFPLSHSVLSFFFFPFPFEGG